VREQRRVLLPSRQHWRAEIISLGQRRGCLMLKKLMSQSIGEDYAVLVERWFHLGSVLTSAELQENLDLVEGRLRLQQARKVGGNVIELENYDRQGGRHDRTLRGHVAGDSQGTGSTVKSGELVRR